VDGKSWLEKLSVRRRDGQNGRLRIEDIFASKPGILEWWEQAH